MPPPMRRPSDKARHILRWHSSLLGGVTWRTNDVSFRAIALKGVRKHLLRASLGCSLPCALTKHGADPSIA